LVFLALVGVMALSHIGPKAVLKGMKPLIFIIVFTGILNLFFTSGTDYLVHWRFIKITYTGLNNAIAMVVRVMLLVSGTFLLTYTTSPLALTDGLELLLNPLKKLKVPVYELSLMMSIALRFIPTLIEETDRIMSAQKARGADLETGTLVERAKALLPLLIPLFVSAFRRADELAVAMECRCYNGGQGRTRMKTLKMQRRDGVAFLLGAVLVAAVILSRYI
jgi:energy-coupling factor transport system permease protein